MCSTFTLALNTHLTQGIYPTLIIILISKQMSPVEHYLTHWPLTEMQFTGVSAPRSALGSPAGTDGGEP